ncbi:MAG: U32 family peptidase [Lachnospiraceae bacterium]|nr:U32 family peptidase [Lachnospiraceae bacterium]
MEKHEFELLAPAGSYDIFRGVIDAGADAVYFGGEAFGARAYAANFSFEDAKKAVLYAHLLGKKAYLTVNTLLKNLEIEKNLYEYIKSYVETGIDAFLVQDFGVFNFIRDYFPSADIHMSTQCALASSMGVSFFTKLGAKRIVLPRELSLEEMKSIKDKTNANLEAFVHGAICICYSGDCLMSSLIGGRSGNRGRCAQPCRLPVDVYLDGKKQDTPGRFMLSPKEMCGINDIAKLYEAGINSLKIEGRMRSAEYAAGVVGLYRKYIDMFLESGKAQKVSDKDTKALLALGSRCGHTNAYYYSHNDSSMFSYRSASMTSDIKEGSFKVEPKSFPIKAVFYARANSHPSLTYTYKDISATVTGDICEPATGRGTGVSDIKKQITKTGNTFFSCTETDIEVDDALFIPLGSLNAMRRECLSRLSLLISSPKKPVINDFTSGTKPGGKGISDIKLALFSDADVAVAFKNAVGFNAIGLTYSAAVRSGSAALSIKESGKTAVLMLPPVIRQKQLPVIKTNLEKLLPYYDKVITGSFDGMELLFQLNYNKSDIILSPRMYTYSDRAIEAFERFGINALISPHELSKKERSHRYEKSTIQYIYGRIPLMYMAACINKNTNGCDKCSHIYNLKDRKGKFFPVKNDCELCMNTIYNSLPLSLFGEKDYFDDLGVCGYIADFCGETAETAESTALAADKFFVDRIPPDFSFETTKGHFNRGVE